MIPEEHKENLVSTGIHFMRAITEAYGTETGMQLWETISSTLDSDVKGQIFFAMLRGESGDKMRVRGVQPSADKISVIKEVRIYTGYGLKEAKDVADMLYVGRTVDIPVPYHRRAEARYGFQRVGMIL